MSKNSSISSGTKQPRRGWNRLRWSLALILALFLLWRITHPPLSSFEQKLTGTWVTVREFPTGRSVHLEFVFNSSREMLQTWTETRRVDGQTVETTDGGVNPCRWKVDGHLLTITPHRTGQRTLYIQFIRLLNRMTGNRFIDAEQAIARITFLDGDTLQFDWYDPMTGRTTLTELFHRKSTEVETENTKQ